MANESKNNKKVSFINKKANYSKLKKIKTNDKNFKDLLSEKNIKIFRNSYIYE